MAGRFILVEEGEPDEPRRPAGRFVLEESPQPTAPSRDVPARQAVVRQPERTGGHPIREIPRMLTGDGRRQPGVGEIAWQQAPIQTPFDVSKPETWLDDFGRSAATGFGFFFDPDTESRAKILQRQYPTAQFRRDEFGNLQARYTPTSPWAYFNRPGASTEDAQTFANEVVKYTPAARAASGATTLGGRAVIAATTSGATRALSDTAAMSFGGNDPTLEDTALAAAVGGGAQFGLDLVTGAAQGGRQVLQRVMRENDPQVTGNLRAGPVEMVETGRINPGDAATALRGATDDLAARDVSAAQRATQRGNEAASAYAAADEFGIPLTRGQATGDARQIAQEQRWARGGASEGAERVMRDSVEDQAIALQQSGARLASRGQAPLSQGADDAGNQFRAELIARRDALEEQADRAYKEAFDAARAERVPASDELAARVSAVVDDEFLAAPAATNIIDRLQGIISKGEATFAHVERARQALNRVAQTAADSQDNAALYAAQRIKRELDDWAQASMRTEGAQQTFAGSRQVFSELQQLYGSSGARDAGGRALERVMDLDRTGQQVVEAILGAGSKPTQATLATVKRIRKIATETTLEGRISQKVGEKGNAGVRRFNSDTELPTTELQVIREAVIYRALQPLANRPANGALPAQSIATNLRRMLDGESKEIAAELFTKPELALIRRYLNVVEKLVPPAGTVNYSGTAYEISRMLQSATDALFTGVFSRLPALIFRAPVQTIQGDIRGGLETIAAKRAVSRPMFDINLSPNASVGTRAALAGSEVVGEDPALSGEAPQAPYIDPYTGQPVQ